MKKNITYIAFDAVMSLVAASGCPTTEKAAWVRVNGAKGRRLYVPKCKNVGRIDLANLNIEHEGVRDLGGESFGSVTQQLDFGRPEADVLSALAHCLEMLAELPALEPKPRKRPATQPAPAVASSPEDIRTARLARIALIARVAAEKGVAVSPLAADMDPADEAEPVTIEEQDALLEG